MNEIWQIPLAPPDYPFTGSSPYSVQFTFFFHQPQSIQLMSDALQRTLEHFYPVKSQLILEHGRFYLQPGNEINLEVIEHKSEECLPIVSLPSELEEFYLEVKAEENSPLARFCLHQYQDGALLVANIAHCVVDGYSFFYFMSSWARECRGESYGLPCHERERLIPDTTHNIFSNNSNTFIAQFSQITGLAVRHERQFTNVGRINWEANAIPPDKINELKATCLPNQPSDNSILCAYLWQKYAQLWHACDEPETLLSLNCALDFRRIYRKVIPRLYFGNAFKETRIQLPLERVLNSSLGELAKQIQSSVQRQRPSDIDQFLLALDTFHNRYGVERMPSLHVSDPESGMLITNLSKAPLQDLDFGSGAPFALMPLVSATRVGVILPSSKGIVATIANPITGG